MIVAEALLEIKNLSKNFGALRVTDRVNLTFEAGRLRCIIGPNGAGKTTLFNLITGAIRPDEGEIFFDGREITFLKPYERSRLGIIRKFQVPTVFEELTVYDNLSLSALGDKRLGSIAFSAKAANLVEGEVMRVMETIHLSARSSEMAANLSHGEKQWLEIGMVLARRPRIMLLDEPTAGMSPHETVETSSIIRSISQNVTTVVIEHDIKFLKEIGQHVTVLHQGAVLVEGTFEEVESNEQVRDVYLGRGG